MFRRAAALTLTFLFANAFNLSAADRVTTATGTTPGILSDAIARAAQGAEPTVTLWTLSQTPKRPAALPALYGTYVALQVMDVMSTKKALAAGAREANPLMRKGNMGTTIAIKAASGTATVYIVEKMWKKNRVGAIVLMAVVNGVGAAVVAHNHRIARK